MSGGAAEERKAKSLAEIELAECERDMPALLNALQDADFEVRIIAAEAVGEVGGERANITLLHLARDRRGERPEVRVAALRGLGRMHGGDRYAAILEEFITGDNRRMVEAARRMLLAVDPAGYPARLVSRGCLDHSAIGIYGRSREPTAVGLIARFISGLVEAGDAGSSRYWGKVYAAVRALGNIGGGESVRILDELLTWLSRREEQAEGSLKGERFEKIGTAAGAAIEKIKKG